MSALLQSPDSGLSDRQAVEGRTAPPGERTDHQLVAAVRRGDDRAFECLYERYQRRIHAYVFGMVKDHQRAEDVTQEIFVAALRRMRATERPIAFKPWIYEIAKNACIDQFRRSRRAEEVSFDADDGLAPSDYGRLVSAEPVPDAALAAKQQLDHLCGAFGGLSDAHHEILVLRELEGLSYREIGERMGMSRPAVESTLFRARRRLTEEYDELASGQRCQRVQSIIATASSGRLGARDTRRLARHVAHCQPCRRQALAAGVDSALVARKPIRRRAVEKVAALFPFPFLARGRRGTSDSWIGQLPMFSDHAAAGTAKVAAAAVLLVAGLGAGVSPEVAPAGPESGRDAVKPVKAIQRTAESAAPALAVPNSFRAPDAGEARARAGERREGERSTRKARGDRAKAKLRSPGTKKRDGAGTRAPDAGGGYALPGGAVERTGGGSTQPASAPDGGSTGGAPTVTLPEVELPALTAPQRTTAPVDVVRDVVETVPQVTQDVTGAVDGATGGATEPVSGAVNGLVGGLTGG